MNRHYTFHPQSAVAACQASLGHFPDSRHLLADLWHLLLVIGNGRLYNALRHQIGLDPNLSPRRPLLAAFWWLRQAHLLSLGVEIDQPGAQRTRNKELRWTDRLTNFQPNTDDSVVRGG